MARLGWIPGHQCLRLHLELLCEVATRHSSGLNIHVSNILLCYPGHSPCESANAPGCKVRLCQFCQQHWLVGERDRLYRRLNQHQLRFRLPRLCDSPCRGSQSPRENGAYRHHGYGRHWVCHLMVLLHRPLLQHEQPQRSPDYFHSRTDLGAVLPSPWK